MTEHRAEANEAVNPMDPDLPKSCTYHGSLQILKDKNLGSATHVTDRDLVGGTLITIDGPEHSARRRLEGSLFKPEALHRYEEGMLQPAIEEALSRTATSGRDPNGVVRADLVRLGRLTMLAISSAVIGLDDLDSDERRERLGDVVDNLIEGVLVEWSDKDHEEIMNVAREWKGVYDREFVTPSLERRTRGSRGEESQNRPEDLLTTLLGDEAEEWDHERILREAVLYLVASTLTTSTALTHTVGHLEEWFAERPDEIERTKDVEFLRRAAMESLRLHPGPHILLRRAASATTVDSENIDLEPGEVVGADIRNANRDSVYRDSPEKFNPDREVPKGIHPEGLTFADGRHKCIGRPLVLGTYGRRDEGETLGILVRMLHALYGAGITVDPELDPVKADSAHDRYARYPVIFKKL